MMEWQMLNETKNEKEKKWFRVSIKTHVEMR